jgi:AGCS family alanine or glycine:cation symporter
MEAIDKFMETLVGLIWNIPLVILLCGTGIVLSVLFKFPQFKGFIHAIDVIRGKYDDPKDPGEISHFQALTTALSATVGLGNIAGVAIAISMGGPGATFWMIVVGLLGMTTKFAECTLALKYREIDPDTGHVRGGPMYYISKGLGDKWKPVAAFFAFACVCSSVGAGNMFQTNQMANILNDNFGIEKWITGLVAAVAVGAVIIGGIKRIGSVTSKLVPFMGMIYIGGALLVIFANIDKVPHLLGQIVTQAFAPEAIEGGFVGVLIQGVRRACFSNEAGMGSAPIAHSAATTHEPVREGVVALLEPFIDTVVICTMTALVILLSGVTEGSGVVLTASAFDSGISGFGQFFVPIAVTLFAYSTLLSWSYYGEQATEYLFGPKAIMGYKILFCTLSFIGAIWKSGAVLNFSDSMLGLMVIPNLIAVAFLYPKLKEEVDRYFTKLKNNEFKVYK